MLFDAVGGSGEEADMLSSIGVPSPVEVVAGGGRSTVDKGEGFLGKKREEKRKPEKISFFGLFGFSYLDFILFSIFTK